MKNTLDKNKENKIKLAAAYRILAKKNMDDLTYTHLSIRSVKKDSFFMYPLGMLFCEVTASSLLEISLDGKVITKDNSEYNATGYFIHGNIYRNRKDINAIFHLHTIAGIAVSMDKRGLLPISQFALHAYDHISYHKYDSLELETDQANSLIKNLGRNYVMFMENHGTLTCGKTIEEAMFYTHHLEQACKVQVLLNGLNHENIIFPNEETCKKTRNDLLKFEKNLGERDWKALIRELDYIDNNQSYKN